MKRLRPSFTVVIFPILAIVVPFSITGAASFAFWTHLVVAVFAVRWLNAAITKSPSNFLVRPLTTWFKDHSARKSPVDLLGVLTESFRKHNNRSLIHRTEDSCVLDDAIAPTDDPFTRPLVTQFVAVPDIDHVAAHLALLALFEIADQVKRIAGLVEGPEDRPDVRLVLLVWPDHVTLRKHTLAGACLANSRCILPRAAGATRKILSLFGLAFATALAV
jgi:hypothetical protein